MYVNPMEISSLNRCGTPTESYPEAWGSYTTLKELHTKKAVVPMGKRVLKTTRLSNCGCWPASHSHASKFLSLSACSHFSIVHILSVLHCYDRSVNIDIISLHHGDSLSCWKPLISSACAPENVHRLAVVCVHVHGRVDCWDRMH